MKTLILLIASFSVSAFADFEKHAPAKINFNQMIEANHLESQRLQEDLSKRGFGERPASLVKSKKKRVTDFIDAELGWGEAPQVVDRRFNSIEEPIVVRLIPKS